MKTFHLKIATFIFSLFASSFVLAQSSVVVVPLGSDESTRVFAQVDSDVGGRSLTNAGRTEINSIEITVPSDGHLIIQGSVFVRSFEDTSIYFDLEPIVNGVKIVPGGFASTFQAGVADQAADEFTLSYVWTYPITSGTHTVSQDVLPQSSSDFFVNRESLNVLFVRTGGISTKDSTPLLKETSKSSGDNTDERGRAR